MSLLIEQSRVGRSAPTHFPLSVSSFQDIPLHLLRSEAPKLPQLSELQVVRHYTRLSQKNFSIDTHYYPLGSCTMKYNPKVCNQLALLNGFAQRHPAAPESHSQGVMACLYELQIMLQQVTGMQAVSLVPAAGAQGEFAGVAMIRAYHDAHGDSQRREMLVPDAAHGTNPASAVMCGFQVKEIPTDKNGDLDLAALRAAVGPQTAGIMLTNPSTLGVFERNIEQIAAIVHQAGGLLYYDGANLNAILGQTRPGDMGFDVVHINLHKTFSTPHGGGGPGAGPVGAGERLARYLPVPMVAYNGHRYSWLGMEQCPDSIGPLMAFAGNVGIHLRAYVYARLLGGQGMKRVAQFASLNANYLLSKLRASGFAPAFAQRRASHEFILTLKALQKETGISAMDVAKRLLDKGYHAPTTYFPLLVPECLLIEPTETETQETLDRFTAAMAEILQEARNEPEKIKQAPHTMPVRRLDDIKAAKDLDITWCSSSVR